jgi:aconitate hydratase
MAFDINLIRSVYNSIPGRLEKTRALLQRPLTLTEKIC